ncbi:hypothetical protein Tco_1021322 [Tanacetum coccineum]
MLWVEQANEKTYLLPKILCSLRMKTLPLGTCNECASDDESVNDNEEHMPALPKLLGADPIGMLKAARDGVASIKRRRRDQSSDGIMIMATMSRRRVLNGGSRIVSTLSFLCAFVRKFSLTILFFAMESANPLTTNNPPVLPTALRVKVVRELNELQTISTYIDSRLENIDQFLNDFANQPNEINMDDLEPDDGLVDTPFVSYFLDSDDDSDDGEVLNELEEYSNAGKLCRKKVSNSFDRDDLAFQCMIGFRNYITDFVVLEDIGEFIVRDMIDVVMGKPFRKVTKLEYDCAKGLISFTKIFDNYTFQMPRTIPRNTYAKKKFMYKNCFNIGPEYQVDESTKEWLIHGHVSLHEVT